MFCRNSIFARNWKSCSDNFLLHFLINKDEFYSFLHRQSCRICHWKNSPSLTCQPGTILWYPQCFCKTLHISLCPYLLTRKWLIWDFFIRTHESITKQMTFLISLSWRCMNAKVSEKGSFYVWQWVFFSFYSV